MQSNLRFGDPARLGNLGDALGSGRVPGSSSISPQGVKGAEFMKIRPRNPFVSILSLAALFMFGAHALPAQQPADLILHGGKIITVDRSFSIVQAMAIRGNQIAAVGTDQQ